MMHCLKSTRRGRPRRLYLERKRPREFSLALEHLDFALLGQQRKPVGQSGDDAILPGPQTVEVDLRRSEHDAGTGHVGGVLDHLGRVQQRLGGDAAHVQAHAAQHRPALDQRDLEAKVGGSKRGGIAARTRARSTTRSRAPGGAVAAGAARARAGRRVMQAGAAGDAGAAASAARRRSAGCRAEQPSGAGASQRGLALRRRDQRSPAGPPRRPSSPRSMRRCRSAAREHPSRPCRSRA